MLEQLFPQVRYALGNCAKFVSKPWFQYDLTSSDVTTIFGCSFGDAGWHHIRRTLQEFDENPNIAVGETTLAQYLKNFSPTSISSLAGVTEEEPLPLFVYPWGTFTNGAVSTTKPLGNSRFCGPSSDEFIADEFGRIIKLYTKLREEGYQPTKYPHSYLCGTWLHALDGRKRFVVMQGNHRMAILAHLKTSPIAVRTSKLALRHIREADITRWPLVSSGRCSVISAKKIFNYFFEELGWKVKASVEKNAMTKSLVRRS